MSRQSSFMQLFKPPLDPSIRKRYRKKERVSVDKQPHDLENVKLKLSLNLKFTHILSSPPSTGNFSKWGEGVILSQRLAKLLRHDLPQRGLTFSGDGAVLLDDVLQLWRKNGLNKKGMPQVGFELGNFSLKVGHLTKAPPALPLKLGTCFE